MKMALFSLLLLTGFACSNRDVVSTGNNEIWLDDQSYLLNNEVQLSAYIAAMLDKPEIVLDHAGTETVADEEGRTYQAVVGTFMENSKLQSVIIPIDHKDQGRWTGECAMFCDCAGDCTSCVIRVIEKCRELSGVCTSGNGGVSIGVVVKDGKP